MELEITRGPSREKLFDSFTHNHSPDAERYSVFFSDKNGKRLEKVLLTSIQFENGGNNIFNVDGYGHVTWGKNKGSMLKFRGYYDTKNRSGLITIETPTV